MKIRINTIDEVVAFIKSADAILGYPDNSGTDTYTDVPEPTEIKDEQGNVIESYFEVEITPEMNEAMLNVAVKQLT